MSFCFLYLISTIGVSPSAVHSEYWDMRIGPNAMHNTSECCSSVNCFFKPDKNAFFSSYCCLKFGQQSIAGGFTVLVEVKLADICINKMAINNYLFLRWIWELDVFGDNNSYYVMF